MDDDFLEDEIIEPKEISPFSNNMRLSDQISDQTSELLEYYYCDAGLEAEEICDKSRQLFDLDIDLGSIYVLLVEHGFIGRERAISALRQRIIILNHGRMNHVLQPSLNRLLGVVNF